MPSMSSSVSGKPGTTEVHLLNPPLSSRSGLLSLRLPPSLPGTGIGELGGHLNGPGKEHFSNRLNKAFCHWLFPSLSGVYV